MGTKAGLCGLILLASGCISPLVPEGGTGGIPDSDCHLAPCPAAPNGPEYQALWAKHQLHLITANDDSYFTGQTIDGDLIAWQQMDWPVTHKDTRVYAFNIAENRFYEVAANTSRAYGHPLVSQGRVVYTGLNLTNGFPSGEARMWLWDSRHKANSLIQTGMGGDAVADAFWHSWLLFRNSGSRVDNENGLWALNVDDHRLVRLYQPPRSGLSAENLQEELRTQSLRRDLAYYGLVRTVPGTRDRSDAIFTVNLTTGERRTVYEGEHHLGYMAPSIDNWIFFGGNNTVFLYNTETGLRKEIVPEGTIGTGLTSSGGDWVVYNRLRHDQLSPANPGVTAYNVKTGRMVDWARLDIADSWFSAGSTDGKRVVMSCLDQLCWSDLPS